MGHIFPSEGVRADPSKIQAIVDMSMPENASDVHHFLGMVTYLGKFLPNLSDKTACLRKLIEKDAAWDWTEEHTKQFRELQHLVTSSPVLQCYDLNLPIKLSVDASKAGMGAVLLQLHKEGWHLVAYASWSLNSSEKRYAQIEKETLATRNDYVLQKLSSTIVECWPETKETLSPELHAYFQYQHEITSAEGLLFKGDRVIIPTVLCKVMKEKLHHGHIGIQRTRARARQVMFWPSLNAEITDMISKCSACIENQAYQQKEPLIFHEIPTEPWFKVLEWNGLVLVSQQVIFSDCRLLF